MHLTLEQIMFWKRNTNSKVKKEKGKEGKINMEMDEDEEANVDAALAENALAAAELQKSLDAKKMSNDVKPKKAMKKGAKKGASFDKARKAHFGL